jgi:hypothetical protein
MDLSALESRVRALESWSDSLSIWLLIATAAVVVGLILEYKGSFTRLLCERPFNWPLFGATVGGILVTIGVAGELAVQFFADSIQTDLRSANHDVAAALNNKVRSAELHAVKLQNDNTRLQRAMLPRHIFGSSAWIKNARERLHEFAGTPALIRVASNDSEVLGLAQEINSLLSIVGWNPTLNLSPIDRSSSEMPFIGEYSMGIDIYWNDKPGDIKAKEKSRVLWQLLSDRGLGPPDECGKSEMLREPGRGWEVAWTILVLVAERPVNVVLQRLDWEQRRDESVIRDGGDPYKMFGGLLALCAVRGK